MIEELKRFIEALREELQHYGEMLGLLDRQQELVVMLADGHIYFYDLATKMSLGSINAGVSGLEGLSLADLDGDGYAELIVTNLNDLIVLSAAGSQLWQVAGAGGYNVVTGQMDNDPALDYIPLSLRPYGPTFATHRLNNRHAKRWTSKEAGLPGSAGSTKAGIWPTAR